MTSPSSGQVDGLRWSDLVGEFFIDRATSRRGLTAATRAAYTADLAAWAKLIAGDAVPEAGGAGDVFADVSVNDLTWSTLRVVYPLLREMSAPATVQRRVGTLRLFTHWLLMEGHLAADPMLRIEAPRRPNRLPAGWDTAELERLADTVSAPPAGRRNSRRWPARDWAMFALLSTTGVRAAELCSMTDRSIEREQGGEALLHVVGKGNKTRKVPVPPEAVDAVDGYIVELDERLGSSAKSTRLFRLASGEPLRPGALNYLVESWIARSGVPKQPGEAAHAFRHSFAKGLIRSGVPVSVVQEFLGHTDLRTTGIYVKATAQDLRDASLLSPMRAILRSRPAAEARGES